MFMMRRLFLSLTFGFVICPPAKAHIHSDTLVLTCKVADKTIKVVVSDDTGGGPLIVYNSKGETFFSFSNYQKTEQNFSAALTFRIGGQKQATRAVDINRVSGGILITQSVQTVFGKASKDKNYDPIRYEGFCEKGAEIQQKF